MTGLKMTMEHTLQIRAGELRALIEDRARDNRTREPVARGYFRLPRRPREGGVSFDDTGRR